MPLSMYLGLLRSCIMYHNPWRKRTLHQFYAKFIKPNDLCFDLGAHVGSRVSVWLQLGASVVGIEPQPHCMTLLQRWYGHHSHLTLLKQAVGAEVGYLSLYISQQHPTVTTLSPTWIEKVQQTQSFAKVKWKQTQQVPVTTLDSLIKHYGLPAFCKIDVEGFEKEVLNGLSHPLPFLSFEYHPATPDDTVACISRLAELGAYSYNWSVGESHLFASENWLTAKAMLKLLPEITGNRRSGDLYARLVK